MARKSFRRLAATLILAVAASLLTACGSDSATDSTHAGDKPQRGGSITVLRTNDIDAWDPDKALQIESFETLPQVMEGLLRPNPDAPGVLPGLADRWEFDAAAKTITFHLRDGATFSDGQPVTAADVAFSVGLWQKNVGYSSLYSAISGATTPDDRTVAVTLKRPSTFTLAWLANGTAVVVPKDFGGKTREAFFKNPIGAGPFEIKQYVPGQSLTLTRNPHYYDSKRPYLDQVTYRIVSDPNQQLLQFQSKQAQMIEAVPLDLVSQFDKDELHLVHPAATIEGAFANTTSGIGTDVHFRKALSYGIDRESFVKSVFGGHGTPAKGGLPPGIEGSTTCDCTYSFDLSKAKEELAQSAYNGTAIVVLVDSASQTSTREGQVLVSMLKAVGIKVDLQPEEATVLFDRFSKGDYDVILGALSSISPTVGDIFGLLSSGMVQGAAAKVVNAAFDKLDVASTDADRTAATKTAENWIGENLPYVPLANPDRAYAVATNVRGFKAAPFPIYPADYLWVD